jgi:predicted benzoate:H+ symporter BenE
MLIATRSGHRSATPISRVTAALPDLPHPHRKRQRRVGAAPIMGAVAVLVAVLTGTAAVLMRAKRRRS